MKNFSLVAACAFAGALYCAAAQAQNALAIALESAWQRSVQARTAAGDLNRARAGQVAADALWAAPPSLELSHRGDPLSSTAGQRESEIGVAWPLLLPGQRSARTASADADLHTAQAAERAHKLRLAGEVREAGWSVIGRRAEVQLAEAQARALQGLADDVARRVKAGDLARTDLLAAQAEQAAASMQAADARQRLAAAIAKWRLLTGMEPPELLEEEAPRDGDTHAAIQLSDLSAEAARRRLELVRGSRRDPPELLVRYRNDTPAANFATERSIGLAVRIPFGTADRNEPREAAALSDVDVAQAEARRTRAQVEAETFAARAGLQAAEEQVAAESSRAALLRERAELLDKAFRAGEAPLPELLRTLASAAQAEANLSRQRAELGLAKSRLLQAQGILP